MSCTVVRQRLLGSERPDKPGPEESRHLAGCSACHAWLRRLVRLERQISELGVPDCPLPATLLERIAEPVPAPPLVRTPLQPSADLRSVREVGRQKLALAFALAMTLALFALAWWAWPPRSETPAPPVVSSPWRKRIDEVRRSTQAASQRVTALANLADEFLDDARGLGEDPAQLEILAREFQELVQSDLFREAQSLPKWERASLLPAIAVQMQRAESKASTLAVAWNAKHAESARSMRQMAESAKESERRLGLLSRA